MHGLFWTTVCLILVSISSGARSDELAEVDDTGINVPRAYISVRTNVTCILNSDCRRAFDPNRTWCGSGVACIRSVCYLMPDYPCARATRLCQERNRTCTPKPCTRHDQCEDGMYCNGGEKCLRGHCTSDLAHPPPCGYDENGTQNLCDETTRSCFAASWGERSLVSLLVETQSKNPFGKQDGTGLVSAQNGSWPSHNHNNDNDDNWWVWVIVVISIIIFFVLVFLVVSVGNRSWTPVPINNAQWSYS